MADELNGEESPPTATSKVTMAMLLGQTVLANIRQNQASIDLNMERDKWYFYSVMVRIKSDGNLQAFSPNLDEVAPEHCPKELKPS
jgi:hypothetical protein